MIFLFFEWSATEGCYYAQVHNSKIPAEIWIMDVDDLYSTTVSKELGGWRAEAPP